MNERIWNVVAVLPSRDEAETIGAVAKSIEDALRSCHRALINVDSSETPLTSEAFLTGPTTAHRESIQCKRGKGWQVLEGLKHADDADIVLLADTDVRNPSDDIYRGMVDAVADGNDLAIAAYRRHWDEGNLTNHIMRPAFCALTGIDIDQPIAGDLAMSGDLARRVLKRSKQFEKTALASCIGGYGIDGLIVAAANDSLSRPRIRTCPFETTKLHAPSFPHLPAIYRETVPVMLDAASRGMIRVGDWNGTFQLGKRELSQASFDRMCHALRLEQRSASPETAMSWPKPLIRAIDQARAGADVIEVSKELWPAYIERVLEYLKVGFLSGADAAAETLRDAMREVLGHARSSWI